MQMHCTVINDDFAMQRVSEFCSEREKFGIEYEAWCSGLAEVLSDCDEADGEKKFSTSLPIARKLC